MAKSDSFFIRAGVTTNAGTYAQTEIDLGSFVNLGVSKSTLLKIHNISVQYADSDDVGDRISDSSGNMIGFQLTTQTQSDLVYATDKSLVSSGSLQLYNGQIAEDGSAAADFATAFVTQDMDVAPQNWQNGYLVGVDSMFLGTKAAGALDSGNVTVSIVLECELTTATQANSVALALSQQ
jgi:hypothetical protein